MYLDLCEPNYIISEQVYEFFNTFSSGFILMVGIAGSAQLIDLKRIMDLNLFYYSIYFYFLIAIGVGKILTHVSGLSDLSILYNLPIIYSDVIILYKFTINKRLKIFNTLLSFYLITVTIQFAPIPNIILLVQSILSFSINFHLIYHLFIKITIRTVVQEYYLRSLGCLVSYLILQNIELFYCGFPTYFTYSIGNIFFAWAYWYKILCILYWYNFRYDLGDFCKDKFGANKKLI